MEFKWRSLKAVADSGLWPLREKHSPTEDSPHNVLSIVTQLTKTELKQFNLRCPDKYCEICGFGLTTMCFPPRYVELTVKLTEILNKRNAFKVWALLKLFPPFFIGKYIHFSLTYRFLSWLSSTLSAVFEQSFRGNHCELGKRITFLSRVQNPLRRS